MRSCIHPFSAVSSDVLRGTDLDCMLFQMRTVSFRYCYGFCTASTLHSRATGSHNTTGTILSQISIHSPIGICRGTHSFKHVVTSLLDMKAQLLPLIAILRFLVVISRQGCDAIIGLHCSPDLVRPPDIHVPNYAHPRCG